MLGALSSAVSGLDAFQQDMNVIGNNIANVNTTGFKDATVDLADSFSNTLQAATGSTSTTAGTNAIQVGTGVGIAAINNDWATGTLAAANSSDLAINGLGFFIVRDPTASTTIDYATQDGTFTLDASGYLTAQNGMRVQGYAITGTPPNTTTATTLSDVQIGTTAYTEYSVSPTGVVSAISNGVSTPVSQIVLQNFADPNALESNGGNIYSNLANAAPTALTAPGSNGLGQIVQGSVELSNVDLSAEMANLITAQRGFEANSKIVTASDEMLQTVVNMVH